MVGFRLLLLVSLWLVTSHTWSETLRCKVSGAPNWYPVYFFDQDAPKGVMVDVLKEVSNSTSIEFEFYHEQPWPWVKKKVQKGDLDVLAGAFYNEQRGRQFVYSDAVLTVNIHIFTKKDRGIDVSSLGDLKHMHGLRPLGGSYGEEFDRYADKHLSLTEVTPKATMLKMVLHGRADYAVLLERDGKEQLLKPEFRESIVMHDTPKIPVEVHLVFSKTSPCISRLKDINQSINYLTASGKIAEFEATYRLNM